MIKKSSKSYVLKFGYIKGSVIKGYRSPFLILKIKSKLTWAYYVKIFFLILLHFLNAFLRANSMNFPSFLFFFAETECHFFQIQAPFSILVSVISQY